MTPSERKKEAVKNKIDSEFVSASSSSDSGEEEASECGKKKRKIDEAKDAQITHKKMCEKAMNTMDSK